MSVWFTADTHFYHSNIIRYSNRPFTKNLDLLPPEATEVEIQEAKKKDVEDMNEELVKRWNEKVQPGDVVYHLGDFSLARRPVELFLKRLNGVIHLYCGNHDQCHPVHAKKPEKIARLTQWYLDQGFASVQLEGTITIAGEVVKLHHMPYIGDHTNKGERYAKYRPIDEGGWLLHGHIHNLWKTKGKMINVGVDVWNLYPVSLEQIEQIIKDNK